MRLRRLKLTDYRNFVREQVSLLPRLNFFLGDNGQGKTNLLEAVYLVCRGVSFRASDAKSLLRQNASGRARISAEISRADLDYTVDITVEGGRKSAIINGKRANSAALMEHFPTVLFSPESLSAIKEGPDQRRQLIDELLTSHDPKKGQLLREFSRALRSRNRLLKNLAEGIGSRVSQEGALDSLNKIYLILATHLTMARIQALKDIQPAFETAMCSILDESVCNVSTDYLVSDQSARTWNEAEIFDALRKRHSELASREIAAGSSLVGPHKHDVKLLFDGNDSRFYCSQGQQRALILALKIAQIVYHHEVHQTYPVLLLDDVLSELDVKKRVNLMKFLEAISAQILITSTDLTWSDQFGLDRNSIFRVTAGHVTPAPTEGGAETLAE